METLHSLKDLFMHELKDLYSAEDQILEALPQMAEASHHQPLKDAFKEHERVTRDQVRRLELIAEEFGVDLRGHKCNGIEGIIKEGEELLKADTDRDVRDAGLIGAAQRVEHYEMAGYGTARTLARRLGYEDAAASLQQTLDEEASADHELTEIAESMVNPEAMT